MDHEDRYENATIPENKYCCTKFCLTQLDHEFKSKLKSFLSKLSRSEKQIFLYGMISLDGKKHSSSKPVQKSAKNFQYNIKINGVLWGVCKIAFIDLHDTTIHVIRNLCMKMLKKNLVPFDDRGKHDNMSSISEQTKNLIETHISNILQTPSVFKCTKKKVGEPNILQLWLDFNKTYGESGFRVSRATYKKYIKSFLTPDVLSKFSSANFAYKLYQQVQNRDTSC